MCLGAEVQMSPSTSKLDTIAMPFGTKPAGQPCQELFVLGSNLAFLAGSHRFFSHAPLFCFEDLNGFGCFGSFSCFGFFGVLGSFGCFCFFVALVKNWKS